jgi:hypothetical protein
MSQQCEFTALKKKNVFPKFLGIGNCVFTDTREPGVTQWEGGKGLSGTAAECGPIQGHQFGGHGCAPLFFFLFAAHGLAWRLPVNRAAEVEC